MNHLVRSSWLQSPAAPFAAFEFLLIICRNACCNNNHFESIATRRKYNRISKGSRWKPSDINKLTHRLNTWHNLKMQSYLPSHQIELRIQYMACRALMLACFPSRTGKVLLSASMPLQDRSHLVTFGDALSSLPQPIRSFFATNDPKSDSKRYSWEPEQTNIWTHRLRSWPTYGMQ